jgi:polyisoprenoid-binding protein YceI
MLDLHGTSRTLNVPLDVNTEPGALTVRGTLQIRQTDFGITPFSILGGAIQVKDEVDVRFDIRAVRMKPGDPALAP